MNILYRLEATGGGIYAYARHQIAALVSAGARVTVLCREGTKKEDFNLAEVLAILPRNIPPIRLRDPIAYVRDSRNGISILCKEAKRGYDLIMLDCLREYLSPFWIRPLQLIRESGVRIGIMNHDPRRDFRIGPQIWHEYCLREVYRSVSDIFVHGDVPMTGWKRSYGNALHEVPHGPLVYPQPTSETDKLRSRFGFEPNDFVILSFGQVRDGKQLDKLIRSISRLPERVKLLVAGRIESTAQKDRSYYLKVILYSGVVDRVFWEHRYIPDEEVSGLFECCDAVATFYTRDFLSSSGVMSSAVAFGKPIVGSCGDGPMKLALERYPIGEWVPPGDLDALTDALRIMSGGRKKYNFEKYLCDHCWEKNANSILKAVGV